MVSIQVFSVELQLVSGTCLKERRLFTQNGFLVLAQTILEVINIFVQFHCLSSYRNDQTCDLACSDVGVREMSLYKVASKRGVFQTSFFFYLM